MRAKTLNNFQRNINPKDAMRTGLSTLEDKLNYICDTLKQYGINAEWKEVNSQGTYEIYQETNRHNYIYAEYEDDKFNTFNGEPPTTDIIETIKNIFNAAYPDIDKIINNLEYKLKNLKQIKQYLENET